MELRTGMEGRGTQTGTEATKSKQWSQAVLVLKLVPERGAAGLGESEMAKVKG